jgi:acetyltransferase-like isoleucine patch superfamily enzyme
VVQRHAQRLRQWFRRRFGSERHLRRHLADPQAAAYSYGLRNLCIRQWGEGARLRLGRFCSIADSVTVFLGGNHRSDWVSAYPFGLRLTDEFPFAGGGQVATRGDVVIGNDVWIGSGATILSGVTIGDGAVIGARAVVARDVPPYAVVVGNPARVVRSRFAPAQVEQLVALRWWDLPAAQIRELVPLLCSPDVEALLDRLQAVRARVDR